MKLRICILLLGAALFEGCATQGAYRNLLNSTASAERSRDKLKNQLDQLKKENAALKDTLEQYAR